MSSPYRVSVYLTGVSKERARDLRDALGRIIKGAGKDYLKAIMRQAYDGERILVYQTNNDSDGQSVAQRIIANGGLSEIEGLQGPEEPF